MVKISHSIIILAFLNSIKSQANLRGIDPRFGRLLANQELWSSQNTDLQEEDYDDISNNRLQDNKNKNTLTGKHLQNFKKDTAEKLLIKELSGQGLQTISKNCSIIRFNHANDDSNASRNGKYIPRTVLTSFPGSGNTWLRHLVHMSTGYHTGSFYNDAVLLYHGHFLGESLVWTDDRVVGVKVHKYITLEKGAEKLGYQPQELVPKAVLMVRSPYRAILSEYNREQSRGHTSAPKNNFNSNDPNWNKFFNIFIRKWELSIRNWMEDYTNKGGQVHVMCFEKTVENPVSEVEKMVKFMEVDFNRPFCVEGNTEGNFKRRAGPKVDYTVYFSDVYRSKAELAIARVKEMLRKGGHEDCTKYFENYWQEKIEDPTHEDQQTDLSNNESTDVIAKLYRIKKQQLKEDHLMIEKFISGIEIADYHTETEIEDLETKGGGAFMYAISGIFILILYQSTIFLLKLFRPIVEPFLKKLNDNTINLF